MSLMWHFSSSKHLNRRGDRLILWRTSILLALLSFSIKADILLSDTRLRQEWVELFHNRLQEHAVLSAYEDVVKRFLMVSNNQYRKSIIASIGKTKKKAHRTEIEISRTNKSAGIHKLNDMYADKTPRKESSHLLWKAQVLTMTDFFNSKSFTKCDLQVMYGFYGLTYPSSYNKPTLAKQLAGAVVANEKMPYPPGDPQEGTSGISVVTSDIDHGCISGSVLNETEPNTDRVMCKSTSKKGKGKAKERGERSKRGKLVWLIWITYV